MWNWIVHHSKRVARVAAGVTLILIAAVLGFVPGIPGWPLALAGLSILAVDFVWAHRLKTKIKDSAAKVVERVRGKKTN
jgi:hypothetical protein